MFYKTYDGKVDGSTEYREIDAPCRVAAIYFIIACLIMNITRNR